MCGCVCVCDPPICIIAIMYEINSVPNLSLAISIQFPCAVRLAGSFARRSAEKSKTALHVAERRGGASFGAGSAHQMRVPLEPSCAPNKFTTRVYLHKPFYLCERRARVAFE